MIQEPSDRDFEAERESHKAPPEYVGAPSEFANAAEVPESVSLLAKIVAGGVLSWSVVALVAGLLALGCAACFLASFLVGSVLR